MPTVSVIIPVYNAEKYLSQCVESVVNQTFKDIEIILVNDGSKDTSGTLCDKWSAKDNRIKVIHKQNSGPAATRNMGTKAATGSWILYLDSDDWYENDTLSTTDDTLKTAAHIPMCGATPKAKMFPLHIL